MVFELVKQFLSQDVIDLLASALPPVLILLGLAVAVRIDAHVGRKQKKALWWVIVFSLCLVVQNILPEYIPYEVEYKTIHITLSALGYSLRPIILLLYIMIVSPAGDTCRKMPWLS